jgi:hypothetical protein
MDQDQTQSWSVSWYDKAMYQISNEYLKAEREKVRKTDFSFKGHNSSKNWSTATIFELDL